jgi:glyoxylase-like metal-dependent hydrolase (beta-lactamase superfamily II)
MVEVRRLSDSLPGEKPQSVRVETVAHFDVPKIVATAGESWESVDLTVSTYQLVYSDHTALIDAGFSEEMAKASGAKRFESSAFARVGAALSKATLVLVTHEHPDHVGGLFVQPNFAKLLGATRLTKEQVDELKKGLLVKNEDGSRVPPPDTFDDYLPLIYDRYRAVAPGVVLIKAPGHTPGSQMIFVKRSDGKDLLFLGDVAWRFRSIELQRERPRLITWLMNEDRDAVMRELIELDRLHDAEPKLQMVAAHDGECLEHLEQAGLLVKGFL